MVLVPFYRGAVVFQPFMLYVKQYFLFSSPFIEERLYLNMGYFQGFADDLFSSPFIEERLYFTKLSNNALN